MNRIKLGAILAVLGIVTFVLMSSIYTVSEVEQAIISGLFEAFSRQTELTTTHVMDALRQTVPLSRTMSEQINGLRAWADGRARNASNNGGQSA